MYKMRMAVLASVLAGLLLLAALPASASAGLAGWQYQREITIQENSGETLTLIVEPEPTVTKFESGESEGPESELPGFAAVVAVIGLLAVYLRGKRR